MGWRSQPTRQVQFDACKVPAGNLLGEEGHGFRYAMAGLDGGRLNIAACSLGAAQAALEGTLAYMGERKAFGQSIDQFQALQFRLADMEIDLQAARIFLRQAAWKLDTGAPDATKACAMAKKIRDGSGKPRCRSVPAASWRLRLPGRLRDREDRARPARAPDPRRHQRDHAADRGAQHAGRARVSRFPWGNRVGNPQISRPKIFDFRRIGWFSALSGRRV
jgi:hypothetical protein